MPSHYVAEVKITRVTQPQPNMSSKDDRITYQDVADFRVRGADLEKLVASTQSHLELVSDPDE